jgi:trehalose utilization protein
VEGVFSVAFTDQTWLHSVMRHIISMLLLSALSSFAAPVRVVVWDEQQPKQIEAYTNFLGNQIATHLRTVKNLEVKSVSIKDPEQGLAADVLDNCDVLIWWGHARHAEISNEKAKEIVDRIKGGKLSLIALHSAHWSEPFVEAMRERTREEAQKTVPKGTRIEYVTPPRFGAPKPDAAMTPKTEMSTDADGKPVAKVTLPICCFPAWRADAKPSHVTTLMKTHPIARGVAEHFDIPQTEMYSDPFHVPKPDAILFEETWDRGEHFRSGCVWSVGKGKVFYFRPGHEVYPIFTQPMPLKIIENAVLWMGKK